MGGFAYDNGVVPLHLLVQDGEHYFFPGTHARWVELRRRVFEETGVWLYITPGPNAYRSFDDQVEMREDLGIGASIPGRSSHGGRWTGQTKGHSGLPTWVQGIVSGAIDIGNWSAVPWEVLERHARAVGLIPDIVVPTEKWHFVDLNPWQVPAFGSAATIEEDDMSPEQARQLDEARNNAVHALKEIKTTKVAVGRIEKARAKDRKVLDQVSNTATHALAEAKTTKVAVGRIEALVNAIAEKVGISDA